MKDFWPIFLGAVLVGLIVGVVVFAFLFGTTSALYFFFYEGMVEKTITKMVEGGLR